MCSRILIIDEGKLIYDGSLTDLKESYGTRRKVVMEVQDIEHAKDLPLDEYLGVSKELYEVKAASKTITISISFDKNDMQVSDVIEQMMRHMQVKDIKIFETELAEIVKEIYNHQFQKENTIV